MEVPFRSQFDSTRYAFVMAFESQNITPVYNEDIPRLGFQAIFRRSVHDDDQAQDFYPVILDLHGKLYRANALQDNGAPLLPVTELPINLSRNVSPYIYLLFALSPRYLQILEEQRTSQQEQVVILSIHMWGTAAIVKPRGDTPRDPYHPQFHSCELIRFEKVETDNTGQFIRIERSAWIDRILPGLGYRHSVLIELPLVRTPPVPEAYQKTAEALDMARGAFEHEDYRGAVKHARDVLEYIAKSSQDKQLSSFCKEHLEPLVGETKSRTIDRSLNSLRDVTNAASHPDPNKPFLVDRSIASYVIETLALNLRYISSVLG